MIPAGGSGKLTARVKTNPFENGRVSKSVAVATDAPGGETLQLVVNFEVVAPIAVLPRPRILLNAREGEPADARVLLHRRDGKPLAVLGFDHQLPYPLTVSAEPVATPGEVVGGGSAQVGDLWIEVALTPVTGPFRHRGTLAIRTDHPDLPVLEIPIAASVTSPIEVRPHRLSLFYTEGRAGGTSVSVRITHTAGREFAITGLELTHPTLLVAAPAVSAARPNHVIRVSLADGIAAEAIGDGVEATLRVRTSDPVKPLLEIPITLGRRASGPGRGPEPSPSPVHGG